MPHCIIEYSDNLDVDPHELMDSVHQAMLDSGLFNAAAIKLRAKAYSAFTVPRFESFVYVLIKMLDGRTCEQKRALVQAVQSNISLLSIKSLSLSIDVLDMDSSVYYKN